MATYLPPDLEQEQADIARQRAYAQLLQQQGMSAPQGQMVGDRYVAPHATQYLAQLLNSHIGGKKMDAADARSKALAEQLAGRRKSWLESMPMENPAQEVGLQGPTQSGQPLTGMTPGKQPSSADYMRWATQGLQVDPDLAKIGFSLSEGARKDNSPVSVKEGETLLDRGTMQPIFRNPKADSVPGAIKEYQYAVSQGYKGSFEDFQLAQKRAGAPSVNVKTDVKTGESLAAQVGPMMKDSAASAEAAVKQIDAANRVVQAIDTNKLFSGPGASARLTGAQIADAFGVGGKDNAEKIANTRQAIRGLAELTLQGRGQMRGQGAITESEGKLAERAMSGDISELTAAEIKQLAKASERAARFNYAQHQKRVSVLKSRPEFSGVAPFYEAPDLPQAQPTQAPAGRNIVVDY